jgi:hypothetical protein
MNNLEQNRVAFMIWMRNRYPALYREALRMTTAPLAGPNGTPSAGLGDFASWTDAFSGLLKNITNVATTYLTSKADVQMVSQNVQRINAGLPPLNASGQVMSVAEMQAAGYSAATISQVEANLARSGIFGSLTASTGIPSWAIFGALGLGAFVLLRRS